MVEDRKLEQVRKLLTKAADPATTEHEAEALNRKAAEMIARYGFDDALLQATGDKPAEQVEQREIKIGQPYGLPRANLLSYIARFHNARSIAVAQGSGAWAKVPYSIVVGFPSDLDRIEFLFTHLLMQAAPLMRKKPPQRADALGRPVKIDTSSFRYDALEGFGTAVYHRLKQVHERTKAAVEKENKGGPSVELVLRDRSQLVDDKVAQLFPVLESTETRRRRIAAAFNAGYEAGENADLGQDRLNPHRRALPA